MELSPGWVSAIAAVTMLFVVVAGFWLRGVFGQVHENIKSEARTREAACTASASARAILFQKHDANAAEIQAFRLHVAERYVSREDLRELLSPLVKGIQEIKDDLRDARKNHDAS